MQARSQGGGGRGGRTTPPVAHPKDFVPPFSNFVPPFSNFVPPFSNFVPPFSNFVPPFSKSLFHPLAILFHPWNMWMTSHGQCPRGGGVLVNVQEWGRFSNWWRHTGNVQGGGGACECPRVGAFFKLMTSRGQCPRGGGAPGVPPIEVQTPPTLAGWLRAWNVTPTLTYGTKYYWHSNNVLGTVRVSDLIFETSIIILSLRKSNKARLEQQ